MFLEYQSSILECFLRVFSFAITGMNNILKFLKIENNFLYFGSNTMEPW